MNSYQQIRLLIKRLRNKYLVNPQMVVISGGGAIAREILAN